MTSPIYTAVRGVIAEIDYYGPTAYLGITADDGKRYRVSESRIVNAPCGHRCLARVGDEVSFILNADNRIAEVRFVKLPQCEIADDEVSVVSNITNGMIFGKRVTPNCGCPILIGQQHKHPDFEIGMVVRHNLGRYNNKALATNVRVDWMNPYGETREFNTGT